MLAALLSVSGCTQRIPREFNASSTADLSCRQIQPSSAPPPTWSGPADPQGRFLLSRWCETVGPVLFHPRPSSVENRPVDRLAVVSWNIHEGGGDVDELVRRLRLGEYTAGEPVDHFVLLLQEATRRDRAVPLRIPRGYPDPGRIDSTRGSPTGDVRRFADEGFAVLYAPSMRNGVRDGDAEDRGNAIVSTLPLQAPHLIELPLERQRRVVAAAAVEARNGHGVRWRLDLLNVHLDTAFALLHGGPFASRRRQAQALLDELSSPARAADGATATVLAGDLNTWMGDREGATRALRRAFPESPAAEPSPTWTGPLGVRAALDHVFVRGAVSATRVTRLPSRFGSDHYPLLTVLRFRLN